MAHASVARVVGVSWIRWSEATTSVSSSTSTWASAMAVVVKSWVLHTRSRLSVSELATDATLIWIRSLVVWGQWLWVQEILNVVKLMRRHATFPARRLCLWSQMTTSADLRVRSASLSWILSSVIILIHRRSLTLSYWFGLVVIWIVLRWPLSSSARSTMPLWPEIIISWFRSIRLLSRLFDLSSVFLWSVSLELLILLWHSIDCWAIWLGLDSMRFVSSFAVLSRLLELVELELTWQSISLSSTTLDVCGSVSIDVRLLWHNDGWASLSLHDFLRIIVRLSSTRLLHLAMTLVWRHHHVARISLLK